MIFFCLYIFFHQPTIEDITQKTLREMNEGRDLFNEYAGTTSSSSHIQLLTAAQLRFMLGDIGIHLSAEEVTNIALRINHQSQSLMILSFIVLSFIILLRFRRGS